MGKGQRKEDSTTSSHKSLVHAAQPVTHCQARNRDRVSFYSACRWRVPSRMWFSSSRHLLQFPPLPAYFTRTAEELSLEESGKHQWGMRGISAFRFSLTAPSLLSLSLLWTPLHSRALEFSLVSECSPTITTSHKQWGLLIWGLWRRVAIAGLRCQFCWQRASRMALKARKYRLHRGLWKI